MMAKRETTTVAGQPVVAYSDVDKSLDNLPPVDAGEPMETAPTDGRWIEVTEDGNTWVRVRHYQTRARMPGSIAWVVLHAWSTSDPSKYMHRVHDPVRWRADRTHGL
jgi:hypothetical protein